MIPLNLYCIYLSDTKKGYRCSPNLDNLKSNTMKNTSQRYRIFSYRLYEKWKICIYDVFFNLSLYFLLQITLGFELLIEWICQNFGIWVRCSCRT